MFKRSKLEKQIDKIPTEVFGAKIVQCLIKDQELFLMKKVFIACKYYEYKKTVDWNSRKMNCLKY